MRIYTMDQGLYQSARPHQLSDDVLERVLSEYSISGVVNLWHTADSRLVSRVAHYWHYPIPDGRLDPRVADELGVIAGRVYLRSLDGYGTLVHCWGGRNRSGLVSALVLRLRHGLTGAEAAERVRSVRRGSLSNRHFCRYLESLPRPA